MRTALSQTTATSTDQKSTLELRSRLCLSFADQLVKLYRRSEFGTKCENQGIVTPFTVMPQGKTSSNGSELVSTQQLQANQGRVSAGRKSVMRDAGGRAADLLFPPNCVLCAIPLRSEDRQMIGVHLCNRCVSDLTTPNSRPCMRCARPLPKGAPSHSNGCPNCRGKRFRFDRAHAIGVYGGMLRDTVLQMKSGAGESLTLSMGHLLGEQLAQNLTELPSHIVAVPTHWTRRLRRNVNCAEILLESAATRIGLRSSPRLVRCRRKTSKQALLLPQERLANVRGAYRVSAGYAMNGAKVLLIDDVMTTGATANEIAKILRRAGAASVEVAVVARGIGFDS